MTGTVTQGVCHRCSLRRKRYLALVGNVCEAALISLFCAPKGLILDVQTCQQPDLLQDRFDVGGKARSIALQLVLQQCCKTSCMFFVTRFSVP